MSTETVRLIRDGENGGGKGVWRCGKRESIYTYHYTVTTRMTCIKMGRDESHSNVSLTVRDKVTRLYPQTTTFEEKGESKWYRTKVLPLTSLGQTVSQHIKGLKQRYLLGQNTTCANYAGNLLSSSYKTTLKQQLNGEKQLKMNKPLLCFGLSYVLLLLLLKQYSSTQNTSVV